MLSYGTIYTTKLLRRGVDIDQDRDAAAEAIPQRPPAPGVTPAEGDSVGLLIPVPPGPERRHQDPEIPSSQ
jgi:hypothetical protein